LSEDIGTPSRILIVHDDPDVREISTVYLTSNNVSATAVSDQSDVKHELINTYPCIILLGQADEADDGIDLLRKPRTQSNVPRDNLWETTF
jgi:DNA-binding response OmpR family regulator